MAGIVAIYYVGTGGGYMGSDGMMSKDLTILVGAGDREWLEAGYVSSKYRPIGPNLKSFVPHGPGERDTLRIAMILFASNLFESCPSFEKVKAEVGAKERLDLNYRPEEVPHLKDLVEESRAVDISGEANIYQCILEEVSI